MLASDLSIHGHYWRVSPDGTSALIEFFPADGGNYSAHMIVPGQSGEEYAGDWAEDDHYFGPLVPPAYNSAPITSKGDIILSQLDADNFDQLVCRRAEIFFNPREDRQPSLDANIVFHTETWCYGGGGVRAKVHSQEVRANLLDLLGRSFEVGIGIPLPTHALAQGIILSFESLARGDISPPQPEALPDPAPPPEEPVVEEEPDTTDPL